MNFVRWNGPNTLTLIHMPLGDEHPYEQNRLERSPRYPKAGEQVTLGVATSLDFKPISLFATWKVKGTEGEVKAQGIWESDDDNYSYWKLKLPSFAARNQVSYRFFALSEKEQISSESYGFEVLGWIETGNVLSYRLLSSSLELTCSTNLEGGKSRLRLFLTGSNRLHFQIEMNARYEHNSDEPPEPKSSLKKGTESKSLFRLESENEERIVLVCKNFQIIVNRNPCQLEIRREDGTQVIVEREPIKWLIGASGKPTKIRQRFFCQKGEAFFGFGERFNALNQRGNTIDSRVYEQYKVQGTRTYLPVPFFFSSEGYGLYFYGSRYLSCDLGDSEEEVWSFQAELDNSGGIEYEVIVDNDPKAILQSFVNMSGKPKLPPSWVFGLWMSSNEWDSQATVLKQLAWTKKLNIPATVLVIEAWSDESTFYIWNDAQYDPKPSSQEFSYSDFTFPSQGKWPDPKAMIEELHENGVRVLLWQIPVMNHREINHPQNEIDRTYMIKNNYCVLDEEGNPYEVRPPWFKGGLVLDFTNEAATEWWLGKRSYLLEDLDIDGFKTDGGEHLWGRNLQFADGKLGEENWNLYPNQYVGAYHQLLREKKIGEGITFSRSGYAGAQQFPCHWAGDENSTWGAYRASILAGLNAGLSGIPFWGWDIAGFSGQIPSADLYLRATAMATFCPIMQYHSEFNNHLIPSNDRTPWNIEECTGDEDVVPIFRKYANLRMNLLPYIFSQAKESSKTGLPLMRALPLEFGEDSECDKYPYQYLFGESLLIAPVIRENIQSQTVYLPEGDWYDFWTGHLTTGPLKINYSTPKDTIPVFVRAGTVLPLNLNENYKVGHDVGNTTDMYKNLTLKIYPPTTGSLDSVWFDLVSKQYYKFQCDWISDGVFQIEIPSIPHELTLGIIESNSALASIDDLRIAVSNDLKEFGNSNKTIQYRDERSGVTYLKLSVGQVSRVIRFAN